MNKMVRLEDLPETIVEKPKKKWGRGVWCHLCSLKQLCKYAHIESCWNINQLMYKKNMGLLRDGDFDRQIESTENCPLLKMALEYEQK